MTLTDADYLTFAQARCNPAEVAEYAGIAEQTAHMGLEEARARERKRAARASASCPLTPEIDTP